MVSKETLRAELEAAGVKAGIIKQLGGAIDFVGWMSEQEHYAPQAPAAAAIVRHVAGALAELPKDAHGEVRSLEPYLLQRLSPGPDSEAVILRALALYGREGRASDTEPLVAWVKKHGAAFVKRDAARFSEELTALAERVRDPRFLAPVWSSLDGRQKARAIEVGAGTFAQLAAKPHDELKGELLTWLATVSPEAALTALGRYQEINLAWRARDLEALAPLLAERGVAPLLEAIRPASFTDETMDIISKEELVSRVLTAVKKFGLPERALAQLREDFAGEPEVLAAIHAATGTPAKPPAPPETYAFDVYADALVEAGLEALGGEGIPAVTALWLHCPQGHPRVDFFVVEAEGGTHELDAPAPSTPIPDGSGAPDAVLSAFRSKHPDVGASLEWGDFTRAPWAVLCRELIAAARTLALRAHQAGFTPADVKSGLILDDERFTIDDLERFAVAPDTSSGLFYADPSRQRRR